MAAENDESLSIHDNDEVLETEDGDNQGNEMSDDAQVVRKFGGRGKLKDHMDKSCDHKELRPVLVCATCQSIFEAPTGAGTHMLKPCAYDDSLEDYLKWRKFTDDFEKAINRQVSSTAKSPPIVEEVRNGDAEPKIASNVDSVDKEESMGAIGEKPKKIDRDGEAMQDRQKKLAEEELDKRIEAMKEFIFANAAVKLSDTEKADWLRQFYLGRSFVSLHNEK